MPKTVKKFTDQLNFLTRNGTINKLVAIGFFMGAKGRYSIPAKRFIEEGIANFESNLSPKDKKIYEEILGNVNITNNLGE